MSKIYSYKEIVLKIRLLNSIDTDKNKVFNYISYGLDGDIYEVEIKYRKYSEIWDFTATKKQ